MTTIYQQQKNMSDEINPVFQTTKHNEKSEKYQFISSNDIGKFFEASGFTCEGTSYSNVRNPKNLGFQKHIMIFSKPDLLIDSENKMQFLVTNSHNGRSSVKLNVGVYRAICANGLVAGDSVYSQTVRHVGKDIKEQLKESLYYILGRMTSLKDEVERMKNTEVHFNDAQRFMKNCVDARFKDIKHVESIQLSSVDQVRRSGDVGQDLYTVFNRVQESILKGGIKYTTKKEVKKDDGTIEVITKRGSTRQVTSIEKNIALNKIVWNEASKLVA